ncbi:MAG: FAD-dependent monooxygenase [Proteobacteria bacterium]|nr:FAD-dependent monooxygenase [Pseudomonadota bacterium]MDA1064004.1 FAD-dependent monooxygenase [Pseudomonadota bacterium]
MNKRYHVVIVGAGVAGLAVAALLAQCKQREQLKLTVIDADARVVRRASDDVALRVSAIATGSAELLQDIGAWLAVIATRACAYDSMRVWDESSTDDSGDALRFDAADFAVSQLGFIVENDLLVDAILGVVERQDVDLLFSAPIVSLETARNTHQVVLQDGRKIEADLIIGADGAHSLVRECAGIESREWEYEQVAFVSHLRPEKSHANIARQRFLATGPLGMLPLVDGRISVVWSTTAEQAQWAMSATDEELGSALGNASDHVLGRLSAAGPRGAFPLRSRHVKDYVKAGIALVGDAAHAVHPLAGQGANLGLQDAVSLADVINTALQHGEYPGDRPVLRRYERARKGANATMLHFMTGLNRLFATDSALLKELRTTGMWLFNHSGPIREHVVKVALGTRR